MQRSTQGSEGGAVFAIEEILSGIPCQCVIAIITRVSAAEEIPRHDRLVR